MLLNKLDTALSMFTLADESENHSLEFSKTIDTAVLLFKQKPNVVTI